MALCWPGTLLTSGTLSTPYTDCPALPVTKSKAAAELCSQQIKKPLPGPTDERLMWAFPLAELLLQ